MLREAENTSTIGALAHCRQTVMERAHQLIGEPADGPDAAVADDATLPAVSGLLMASLEELKVAEEELQRQNTLLGEQRAAEDQIAFHYRQLFQYAPVPVLITDRYASIQETNIAAALLFRREAERLVRKPLAALLDPLHREDFRAQLSRLRPDSPITDWHLVLQRVGDLPVAVRAVVSFVPALGATGSGVLYWILNPAAAAD